MHAERFRHLLSVEGPFASIYFDDSHDTADAEAQLELKWRGLREQLEAQGGEALADVIEPAVIGTRPPVGRSGRGVVAAQGSVLINEHLIRPPAMSVARVSRLPYLVPLVEHAVEHHTYLLVAVDHAGGDVTVHRNDHDRSESVDGGGYPVHHAHRAETPGLGDPQRTVDNARAKNIRAVSERLTSLVDVTKAQAVFVLGEVQSRSDLIADLPERVAERVVELKIGARHGGVDDEIRHAIDTEFLRRRVAVIDDAAQRFQAGHASGSAADGLTPCAPRCATARWKR